MAGPRSNRAQLLLAVLSSLVVATGIQLILPALPVMQRDLGLSDSQISLVTSAYLLPSVFLAFPTGLLADRVGRRLVFVASLTIFGLCGLVLLFSRSFPVILSVRVVQGAAFAAVHPLSITMIGDLLAGSAQVRAQGQRAALMAVGDAFWPVLGGFVGGIAWFAPFGLQALTIPLALLGWFLIPARAVPRRATTAYMRQLFDVLRNRVSLALQVSGFLRFFFKFVFMTYVPILLVSKRGLSPAFVGIALGASALCGTAVAALPGRLARLATPSRLVAVSLAVIGASLIGLALDSSGALALPLTLAFGAADGAFGVLQNALVTQVARADLRAAFVAASGSIRNLGKFLAPAALGFSLLFLPMETSFVLCGLLALAALVTVPALSRLDGELEVVDADAGVAA